jgi:hypothetical protein
MNEATPERIRDLAVAARKIERYFTKAEVWVRYVLMIA